MHIHTHARAHRYIREYIYIYIYIHIYTHLYIRYMIYTSHVIILYMKYACNVCVYMRPHHLDQVGEALPGEAPVWQAASCWKHFGHRDVQLFSEVQLQLSTFWHPKWTCCWWNVFDMSCRYDKCALLMEALEPWNCVVDVRTVNRNSKRCRTCHSMP